MVLETKLMRKASNSTTTTSRQAWRANKSEASPLLSSCADTVDNPNIVNARTGRYLDNRLVFLFLVLLYSLLILLSGIHIGQRTRVVDNYTSVHPDQTVPEMLQHSRTSHQDVVLYSKVGKHNFGEYKEYSVIHSDRSLNLMSKPFQEVMQDLNKLLKVTYNADKVAIVPGSGTFGMESVARQFATDQHVMVLRNGYFTYRWTQIFEQGDIATSHTVLKAQPQVVGNDSSNVAPLQYAPYPVDKVVDNIQQERPAVLFCAHVETSTGIMLPDDYIRTLANAMHDIGGLLVVDAIASGTIWLDMKELGVDVLISAPQKDWTSPPCCGLVMLSERAVMTMNKIMETSFSLSLKQWCRVMDAYENGGYAYHTTPPTDALRVFQRVSVEMMEFGLDNLKQDLGKMGNKARGLMDSRGLISVAANGFESPGVLVYYSPNNINDDDMVALFQEQGLQIAKGVQSWMIDEPPGHHTFRIGLFGLDKIIHEEPTIENLQVALDQIMSETKRNGRFST